MVDHREDGRGSRERRGDAASGGDAELGRADRGRKVVRDGDGAQRAGQEKGRRGERTPRGPRVHRERARLRGLAPLSSTRLSSTRRAAVLALVVCALVLSIVVPLRNYLTQRGELENTVQQQEKLREQVERLEQRKAQLSDPAQVEVEARERLRYVRPGETPYIVQLPSESTSPVPSSPAPAGQPPADQSQGEVPRAAPGHRGHPSPDGAGDGQR